eukprot:922084-Pleurochrysis_carterae.AAC.1
MQWWTHGSASDASKRKRCQQTQTAQMIARVRASACARIRFKRSVLAMSSVECERWKWERAQRAA